MLGSLCFIRFLGFRFFISIPVISIALLSVSGFPRPKTGGLQQSCTFRRTGKSLSFPERWDKAFAADNANFRGGGITAGFPLLQGRYVFLIPRFGLLPVDGSDRIRSTVRAVFLVSPVDHIRLAANGANICTAQLSHRARFFPPLILERLLFLPLCPAVRAIPCPGTAGKGFAAGAANAGQNRLTLGFLGALGALDGIVWTIKNPATRLAKPAHIVAHYKREST